MTDENKAAESSAAAVAEPEFNPADQYTWSPEQRDKWNETGEIPKPNKQESEPAATPAKEAKSGKTAAESETASKQGKRERKPGEKLSAEERISQLTADKRKLEQDLQAERERSRAAEPTSAATQSEPAKRQEAPKRPNPFKWTGTPEEYEAAMETWEIHQKGLAIQEFQRNEAARVQTQRLQGQLEEVKSKYPDAEGKIKATFEALAGTQLPGVIRAMLDDSECLPDVMYVLSDETTRANFIGQVIRDPGKAVRALSLMEAEILKTKSASVKAEPKEKSEPKTSAEPKPRAPKPLSEVGGRGTAPEDALREAAQANDFRSFEAEQNRRKFARTS